MSIKVFNADDHPMLRKGITDLIHETQGFEWVGSAENGRDALDKIKATQPDIAILDIEMPFMTGLEVAKEILAAKLPTRCILLTLFKDAAFFNKALEIGIRGYLLKESSQKEIIDCINQVFNGKSYVNPELTHYLIDQNKIKSSVLDQLSSQEINILKLIALQKTSQEIASMLFISPKTVSNHRNNISKKLNLSGEQNGLLKWALENKELLV